MPSSSSTPDEPFQSYPPIVEAGVLVLTQALCLVGVVFGSDLALKVCGMARRLPVFHFRILPCHILTLSLSDSWLFQP